MNAGARRVGSPLYDLPQRQHGFELGGRGGLRGRAMAMLPDPSHLTIRVSLSDPQMILDLRFAPESGTAVTDPDVQRMFDALHRPMATAMRRVLSMRESMMTTSQLRADIRRDPLTGVGNRRALAEWTDRDRFAALMIDLDRFKSVNDELGHHAGDSVLRLVAEVIGSQIRSHDLLVRYGGDEFLLLLDGADTGVAEAVAGRIRASVAALDGAGLPQRAHHSEYRGGVGQRPGRRRDRARGCGSVRSQGRRPRRGGGSRRCTCGLCPQPRSALGDESLDTPVVGRRDPRPRTNPPRDE